MYGSKFYHMVYRLLCIICAPSYGQLWTWLHIKVQPILWIYQHIYELANQIHLVILSCRLVKQIPTTLSPQQGCSRIGLRGHRPLRTMVQLTGSPGQGLNTVTLGRISLLFRSLWKSALCSHLTEGEVSLSGERYTRYSASQKSRDIATVLFWRNQMGMYLVNQSKLRPQRNTQWE